MVKSGKRKNKNKNKNDHGVMVLRSGKAGFGFPSRLVTTLHYGDAYALASTTGSLATQVIRVNSTFDPDATGAGHQPLYRDTYAAVYVNYVVVRARIRVTFSSLAAATSMNVGMTFDDNATPPTVFSTLLESSRTKWALLTPLTGSGSRTTLTTDWSYQAWHGVDPFSSEAAKTAVAADPDDITALVIWSLPTDGSATATVQAVIELEQDVLWTELVQPTGS